MPFECPRCVIDTNVLSDFYEGKCLDLIWQIYPGGVWIDPYVCEELKAKYNLDVQEQLTRLQLPYNFTNDYEPEHFIEMAEIKNRRRALMYADISCVVNARIHDATCLSADNAVYKTCAERGVKAARHGGLLQEAVHRRLIHKQQALMHFQFFLDRGLTMKSSVREQILASFE